MSATLTATQWTTPQAPAVRPFMLWCDWFDVWPYIDVLGKLNGSTPLRITATGGNVPRQLTFTVVDRTNVVGRRLANQQRVVLVDNVAGRVLFHGFVKYMKPVLTGPYGRWTVTCVDLSDVLDFGQPIEALDRPIESDAARIGAIMSFATWPGLLGGGFVQTLNAALAVGDFAKTNCRAALEDTLTRTGALPVGYYVDDVGYLHTFSTPDGGAAPYAISDTPNYTTTIPALVEPEFDGTSDVDYSFVYGGSAAASGVVASLHLPRFPARYSSIDAPDATDAASMAAAGAVDLVNRQLVQLVTVTVTGDSVHGNFDGWATGQSIAITNGVMGWVGASYLINGVDMTFVNAAGARRYVLTCGTKPGQKMALVHHVAIHVKKVAHKKIHHRKVRGHKGAAKKVG
jgi:hypothetical protein